MFFFVVVTNALSTTSNVCKINKYDSPSNTGTKILHYPTLLYQSMLHVRSKHIARYIQAFPHEKIYHCFHRKKSHYRTMLNKNELIMEGMSLHQKS